MEIMCCKKCGKLFNYVVGRGLCPGCMKDLEDKFQEVKRYIYDNPGATVAQVSEAMEVSVNQLKQWVREERLEFAEGCATDINCEKCGRSILSGRFCTQCKEDMVRNLNQMYENHPAEEKEEKKSARMRFLQ